jgi:predicted Zn-dependent protease
MKTIKIVALFLILGFCYAHGQTFELDLTATMVKPNGPWKTGDKIQIIKFVHRVVADTSTPGTEDVKDVFYLVDDQGNLVEITSKVEDCFEFEYKNIQEFWDASIITNVLYRHKSKGFQYDLRHDMESDALQYIQDVKSRGLEFIDPYLNTYIYSLIAKIAPYQLIDGRPGSINIIIQDNPSINVCCYPNGTIVLNTGLLAALHTEDELVAVLAHEIAHFVLDHTIQNVNEAISRKKRAEFWSGVLTGVTAVAEGYMAAKTGYYVPGRATLAMATISTAIASQVIERLGMKYNHEQENEADRFAVEALKVLGYDENSLATALSRLKQEYLNERNNSVYVNSYTHPALSKRIKAVGEPNLTNNKEYEQIVSFAVSSVAMMKYSDCRFRQCLPYVNQNIENGVGTADDYILKANCLLSTKNDEASNLEVIELINKAKSLDENNVNIHKSEIIATLRIGDRTKAISLLDNYIQILNGYDLDKINSDKTWDNIRDFVITEREWAKDMIVKLKGMQLT